MTSAREAAGSPPGCRRSALDQLPPPASSNKPLTPFGIEDILGRPRGGSPPGTGSGPGTAATPARLPEKAAGPRGGGIAPSSPLCALEELASKTFQGLELGLLQAAEGREPLAVPGSRPPCKKRRKSRTAFTAQQLRELEQRFLRQKYLSPVDRDRLAARLALSTAQVITWFQNRRAKLKRDLEELRADVASLQALPPAALRHLAAIPDPPLPPAAPGTGPTPPPAELSEEEIDVGD
ncbi:transcription factor LBX2 [Pezoporus wallicus]|uniref:transcription factor LBX2 n=1 Tax=Pezoporus wallicus TaxID=35540 RepID=UPI00255036F2|nr:transcription factor LBX2 [Pezoporus wallicus]XP_061297016.1 transcription factor LBX2 [Pezoporus flaviventris]